MRNPKVTMTMTVRTSHLLRMTVSDHDYCVLPAEDGLLLEKIDKVKVLRNDKREGETSVATRAGLSQYVIR